MNIRLVTLRGFFALLLAVAIPGQAQESGWPRTLLVNEGNITVYPLQVEEMNGDLVRFRAALAYRPSDDSEPVFGAGWFVSKVEIDRTNGVVHPLNLMVSETRFPKGTEDVKQELTAVFAQQSPGWDLDFPLSELVSSLETAEQEAKSVQNLNTMPPAIIYKDRPALLVSFDGEPVLREIENSKYQAVVNTSYPLIFDGKAFYLAAADEVWYRADSAKGPYRYEARPPADIVAMVDASGGQGTEQAAGDEVTAANAPEIVIATTPTELIVTEGPAAFVPLVDDLLVLNNTTDDVFMHISSQQYYIVLAGRWYHSRSLDGPWVYSASDDLPAAFAAIPEGSDQSGARVHVAGTEEAREAVMDAQIPQTAVVERGPVDLDVAYDGDPIFEQVEGTPDLEYANNTGSTVLKSDRQYYLVEDGVWYVSSNPNGPWEVSVYRPDQVSSISPRSPVYNVKYVYIYDSTPDVVYVGYTPGYTGNYVYYNTVVYGTGWYYRPWISPYYYYPRYSTWGFNVSYNSWYGWNFGLSWGWGPFYAGYYSGGFWHHGQPWYGHRYNRWGPRGYRPRPAPYGRYSHGRGGYDRGGHGGGGHGGGGYSRDDYDRRAKGRSRLVRGEAGNTGRDVYVRNQNLYRDAAQRAKVSDVSHLGGPGKRPDRGTYQDTTRPGGGRHESGRVTPTELRAKAQARDSEYGARRDRIIADDTASGRRNTRAIPDQRNVAVPRTPRAPQRVVSEKPPAAFSGRTPRVSDRQPRSSAGKFSQPVTREPVASPGKTQQPVASLPGPSLGKTKQPVNRQPGVSPGKKTQPVFKHPGASLRNTPKPQAVPDTAGGGNRQQPASARNQQQPALARAGQRSAPVRNVRGSAPVNSSNRENGSRNTGRKNSGKINRRDRQ